MRELQWVKITIPLSHFSTDAKADRENRAQAKREINGTFLTKISSGASIDSKAGTIEWRVCYAFTPAFVPEVQS
jgi:hypothetical protein